MAEVEIDEEIVEMEGPSDPEPMLATVPADPQPEPWDTGSPSGLQFLSTLQGRPGFVTDEGLARESPCLAYEIDGRQKLVFSRGIVGPLNDEQQAIYCETVEAVKPSDSLMARLEGFQEATIACRAELAELEPGEDLEPGLACLSRELRSRNLDL